MLPYYPRRFVVQYKRNRKVSLFYHRIPNPTPVNMRYSTANVQAAAILSVSSAGGVPVASSTVDDLPSIQSLAPTGLGDPELEERSCGEACRIDFNHYQHRDDPPNDVKIFCIYNL
jgi:hypothetical protein